MRETRSGEGRRSVRSRRVRRRRRMYRRGDPAPDPSYLACWLISRRACHLFACSGIGRGSLFIPAPNISYVDMRRGADREADKWSRKASSRQLWRRYRGESRSRNDLAWPTCSTTPHWPPSSPGPRASSMSPPLCRQTRSSTLRRK